MDVLGPVPRSAEPLANPAALLFQQEWQIYRKMVDNNFLFHREVYARLNQVLTDPSIGSYRFLDIACGDAGSTVEALKGTRVAHYHGIDLSGAALAGARRNLAGFGCPSSFQEADYVEALREWRAPVDVVWIGLSLHHLRRSAKLAAMRDVCRILDGHGLFLIYENASPDGEDREQWLARWDLQRPAWVAYSAQEWEIMASHVHQNDFPETASCWRQLGREAGFRDVEEIFVAPSDLFRMYCFRA